MEKKKKKLCQKLLKALVHHKNNWLKSSKSSPSKIGTDETFVKYRKYILMRILGISRPSASVKRQDTIPGLSKFNISQWNYLCNLNLDENSLMVSAASKELQDIQNYGKESLDQSSIPTTCSSSTKLCVLTSSSSLSKSRVPPASITCTQCHDLDIPHRFKHSHSQAMVTMTCLKSQ